MVSQDHTRGPGHRGGDTAAQQRLDRQGPKSFGGAFPYGTMAVNLLGCFAIGFLGAISSEKFSLVPDGRILLMTGFCGAFTTFSTFMLETGNLAEDGEYLSALLNVIVSVVAGFVVYRLGVLLGELV
jgi:fluoride exporter